MTNVITAFSGFYVDDINVARDFYTAKPGFKIKSNHMGSI